MKQKIISLRLFGGSEFLINKPGDLAPIYSGDGTRHTEHFPLILHSPKTSKEC